MADRHDRRPGQRLRDHAIEIGFAFLVERGGRFVEEQPVGRGEQRPRDGEPLLFPSREPHLPVVALVEPVGEGAESDIGQGAAKLSVREGRRARGIGERVAQRPDGNIGPLGQQHQFGVGGLQDFAGTERP